MTLFIALATGLLVLALWPLLSVLLRPPAGHARLPLHQTHLALLHAHFARDRHRAESLNLLVDSAIAGAWVPLMHFCLLPSVLLVMVTTFDKISTGIRGLWLRSLPARTACVSGS